MRGTAECLSDPERQRKLLARAEDYERVAEKAEQSRLLRRSKQK
jgi:hypothetical protein